MEEDILLANMIAYEDGLLSFEETVELFQGLVDANLISTLQGFYGRIAQRLIADGWITEE